ncbi:MAG: glycosyltransferase [Acidobacteria bacterium]|nr:glycosyltransferase [Acidobacteriota bacterium]
MVENAVPKVSVCMITYNHEPYIAQAIEGVLMQETDFPVELVIGEDCSTDNTRKICEDYAKRFPDKIRLLSRSKNLGMSANFLDTLENCNGEFIAFCDGDDYWTSPQKLQKQVDFLKDNPAYSLCYHRAKAIDEDGKHSPHLYQRKKVPTCFSDLLTLPGHHIPTASTVFRNEVPVEFPSPLKEYAIDIVVYLIIAGTGKFKCFEEEMSVYRVHSGNYTSSVNRIKQLNFVREAISKTRDHFSPFWRDEFEMYLSRLKADVAFVYYEQGENALFKSSYDEVMKYRRYLPFSTKRALFLRSLIVWLRFRKNVLSLHD